MAVFPDGCGVTPQRPWLIAPLCLPAGLRRIRSQSTPHPGRAAALFRHQPQPLGLRAGVSPSDVTAFPDERRSVAARSPPPPKPLPSGLKPVPSPAAGQDASG